MDSEPGAPFALDAKLPQVLECSGEFGAELNSFVPFIYWLHQAGLMRGRQVLTYRGMRAFYYFLDETQLIEKTALRAFVAPQARPAWLPNRDDHESRRSPFEMFPDYRAQYGRDPRFAADRDLLIIHNKFSIEWNSGPVNTIPLPSLARLFDILRTRFRIIYLRPGITTSQTGYSGDHQPDLSLADLDLLGNYPDVILFEHLARVIRPEIDYNELKLRLYAHSHFHLTVQGGNAHMAAMFSGGLVGVLHRAGRETRHSYQHGHFGYAANPSPLLLICRTLAELDQAADIMQQSVIAGGPRYGPAGRRPAHPRTPVPADQKRARGLSSGAGRARVR